jgi:HD-like signal output (HDOD) protein
MIEQKQVGQNKNEAAILVSKLKSQGKLPALSGNVKSICNTTDDEKSNISDLSKVILRDTGLTSSILTTINSALYGLKYPVKTVTASVSLLGFEKTRALALGLTLFNETAPDVKDQKLMGLYASAYFAGNFALNLAREIEYKTPEEIFVAGLLNQLPLISLANCFPEKFKEMEGLIKKGDNKSKACKKAFNCSYTSICEETINAFNLKGKAAEVVSGHSEDKLMTLVDCACDLATLMVGEAGSSNVNFYQLEKKLGKVLKDDKFDLDSFIQHACNLDDNIKLFFNIGHAEVKQLIKGIHDPESKSGALGMIYGDKVTKPSKEEERKKLKETLITELTLCREKQHLNELLSMSMEALYRYITDSDVILFMLSHKDKAMLGRYYMGSNKQIEAKECQVSFEYKKSPIIACVRSETMITWGRSQGTMHLPLKIQNKLLTSQALIMRIALGGKPIGCYLISRKNKKAFTEDDKNWLSKVIEQVNKGLEKKRQR